MFVIVLLYCQENYTAGCFFILGCVRASVRNLQIAQSYIFCFASFMVLPLYGTFTVSPKQ
jgi:hypothetical protein